MRMSPLRSRQNRVLGMEKSILSGPNDPALVARARAWWGADVTSFHDGSSTSAPLTGVNCSATFCNGNTYPQVYDALGRFVFVGLSADF